MFSENLLNPAELKELKQKKDFINIFTLVSMWTQVILAFVLYILFPNLITFFYFSNNHSCQTVSDGRIYARWCSRLDF
jgi:uncharacterized membrane protein (DUF485 family)